MATSKELLKMTQEERVDFLTDLVSRKDAKEYQERGMDINSLPSALPDGTMIASREGFEDIIIFNDCSFPREKLEKLMDYAKENNAIQAWEWTDPDQYGYCRDCKFTTALGEIYIIEWWKNEMFLKTVGGMKIGFHHIELGHYFHGSFGPWEFHIARYGRPTFSRNCHLGDILCETQEMYEVRMAKEKAEKENGGD